MSAQKNLSNPTIHVRVSQLTQGPGGSGVYPLSRGRARAMALCCSLLLVLTLAAQPQAEAQDRVRHEGRSFGYVPGHLKQPPRLVDTQVPQRAGESRSNGAGQPTIAAASYQPDPIDPAPSLESIDLNIPAPEPIPSMIEESPYDHGCCGNLCCGLPGLWGRAEYLLWWTRGMNLPPLATTSPDGTPQGLAGVLGLPGTRTLFGNDEVNNEVRSGGRFTLGAWFDSCHNCGVQISYLGLDNETESFAGSQDQFGILARPFFDAAANAQDSRLIVFPGIVEGSLLIEATTEFQTMEVLYRRAAMRCCDARADWLFGYRYAELKDLVSINESTLALSGAAAGSTIDLFDQFESSNRFNGGVIGLTMDWHPCPCWKWEFLAKVALGSTKSQATVSGQTLTTGPNGDQTLTSGGLLTQPTNLGSYSDSGFATVTEFGVNLRRDFHCGLAFTVGYSFLYWSEVSRAGDQIDLSVNPTQIPPGMLDGPARPAFAFDSTSFWAQGLQLGLEYSF